MLLFAQYFISKSLSSHFVFLIFFCSECTIPLPPPNQFYDSISLPVSILLRFYATAEGEHIVESILFNYVLGLSLCSCAFCSPFEILYFVEMHACAYCLCAFTLSAVYRSISFTLNIAPRSSQTVLISTSSITFLLHFPHPSYSRALHLCAFIKLFCDYCWQFCLCFCLFYSFPFCFKSHIHSDFIFLFLASSLFFVTS